MRVLDSVGRQTVPVWAYAIAVMTAIIGLGSPSLFGLFLWTGGLELVDLGMGWRSALLWDGALCLGFFLQHSGMIRRSFRVWLSRVVPLYCHGAFYTVASGTALLLLAACWQPSHINVLVLEGAVRWPVRGLFLLSLAGMLWGIRALGDFDAFGIQAMLSHLRREQPLAAPLTIRGPYRWVRHPLYFFVIVAIWACPTLSLDRILLGVLCTLWIAAGAMLEERDLVAQFGDAYRAYQRKVPMLLPWRLPSP